MGSDWDLLDEHEELEDEESEEEERTDTCGDRVLSEDQRRRWYDDAADPDELTGMLSW